MMQDELLFYYRKETIDAGDSRNRCGAFDLRKHFPYEGIIVSRIVRNEVQNPQS